MRASRRMLRLVSTGSVLALVFTLAACEPSTAGITTSIVGRATVSEIVDAPASVTANGVATLNAPADGTLSVLAVRPGATVKAGALIAVIASPAARKRLTDASAALKAAKSGGSAGFGGGGDTSGSQAKADRAAADAFAAARAAAAKVGDPTVRTLLLTQIAAAQAQYESAAKTARQLAAQLSDGIASVTDAVAALTAAQVSQAQAVYDLAKSTVDSLTLRAPIGGVVQIGGAAAASSSSSLTDLLSAATGSAAAAPNAGTGAGSPVAGVDDVLIPGDLVSAGTPIVTIVDISKLGLVGEVDETDILLVTPGASATVELDAAPGAHYDATVDSVDLLPTTSARGGVAYRTRLSLRTGLAADGQSPAPVPRPGMSAVAHLRVRTAENVIAVPAAAVFTTELGDTIWVVHGGDAARQKVTLGIQGEDLVQVVSGLVEGDRIVVAGADKVHAGQSLT